MFPQLDRELHFGYEKNGSLVVAKSPEDMNHLQELLQRGAKNGVKNLRIIDQKELRELEPYIHPEALGALYSPDAGSLIPYEFTIALAENAADNGVEFRLRREVQAIKRTGDVLEVTARHWEPKAYVEPPVTSSASTLLGAGAAVAVAAAVAAMKGSMLGLLMVAVAAGGLGIRQLWNSPAVKSVGTGGENVTVPQMAAGGSGSSSVLGGVTVATETVRARFVVNAAGGGSDSIARMVGDESFTIKPRLGDYILLHKDEGFKARATLFPIPGKYGKGVLVQKTLWGNLILGPTARDVHDPSHMNMSKEEVMRSILARCRDLVPDLDVSQSIHSFSGARAKSSTGDWVIGPCAQEPLLFHAAGIDSPGLAGCPAIAMHLVQLLREAGLPLKSNPSFRPDRAPIIRPKSGWRNLKLSAEDKSSGDPVSQVVCKCEKVTEAEVVEALRRSLPIDSTQAIRKRTRAGMGHCQGNPGNYNCEARVAAIIARETGLGVSRVGRRPWPGTSMLPQRWLSDTDKTYLGSLGQ
jgi:L-2-hydroxyglutarate oxidase LhgO